MELTPMVETKALYDQIAQHTRVVATPPALSALPLSPSPHSSPPSEPLPTSPTVTAPPFNVHAPFAPLPIRDQPALPSAPPEPSSPKQPPANLPAQLTSFVGREQEMAALRTLLSGSTSAVRLLTLTGPGGSGKTRLALEVAFRLQSDEPNPFPDGYFFVPLATVSDPALVLPAIMETLGIRDVAGRTPLDSLKETLHSRQLLLILDNFEHLAEAAPLLVELLRSTPALRLLVTSRAVLRVYGEQEFPVVPLPTPDLDDLPTIEELARYASVSLFLTRSRAVNPTFTLSQANAPAIAEVCVRLDGLPLAIELAAARCRLLHPAALLARLEDRLGFLQDRGRTPHQRHQTLRATLEWSYQLLGVEERRFFAVLAVFAGSFGLEAVEAVWGEEMDVLGGLEALVDNSLLQQLVLDPDDAAAGGHEPRFHMLSTLREYAQQHQALLPEAERVAERHTRYYLSLARASEQGLRGHDQVAWLQRMAWEEDNLRAALRWALSGDAARAVLGLELAGPLGQYWFMAGHYTEGQRWLVETLATAGDSAPPAVRARALYDMGSLIHAQGDLLRAQPYFEESLILVQCAGDPLGTADALYALGRLANRRHDYERAETLLNQSLALAEQHGYHYRIGYIYNILAGIRIAKGQLDAAGAHYALALDSARRIGNKSGIAFILTGMGELARQRGDYSQAELYYNEAMALARELDQKSRMVMLLHNMAYVVLQRSHLQRAAALFREGLTLGQELPDQENFGMCLIGLGGVAIVSGLPERAAMLFGAGEAILASIGAHLAPADQSEYDRYVAQARAQLTSTDYQDAFNRGRKLTPAQAEELALAAR
jgi:predicted ATPase